jgi:hypothetical protein
VDEPAVISFGGRVFVAAKCRECGKDMNPVDALVGGGTGKDPICQKCVQEKAPKKEATNWPEGQAGLLKDVDVDKVLARYPQPYGDGPYPTGDPNAAADASQERPKHKAERHWAEEIRSLTDRVIVDNPGIPRAVARGIALEALRRAASGRAAQRS